MRDAANAVHSPRSTRSNQMRRLLQICVSCVPVALSLSGMCLAQVDAPPPLTGLTVADKAGDDGRALIVHWDATTPPMQVWVSRSLGDDERKSLVRDARVDAAAKAIAAGASKAEAEAAADAAERAFGQDAERGWTFVGITESADGVSGFELSDLPEAAQGFRVRAQASRDGVRSSAVESAQPVVTESSAFFSARFPLMVGLAVLTITIGICVRSAQRGNIPRLRKIAALDAFDEAVGRATEMGRSVLFIPGIQDMTDIQTVAGLTVLSRVARTTAEYDATLEVPTTRSLVMTAARETVQSAHFAVHRPESYRPDLINYITDEQFGYVAYVAGKMVREKPATCFYMGAFYAESLLFAETGNSIGAIQIGGTAEPSQLPFFVAACDYTLIGEEFFAASAYLSGEPAQLGSIRGQDIGKLIAAVIVVLGTALATVGAFAPEGSAAAAATWIVGALS
ncbi:MAG: hypothetical protein DWI11_07980 [Planctomycetota bacterium]|nr:MAG: hypothetical protein DWI11_07980 [Planctomycetota bacterium]